MRVLFYILFICFSISLYSQHHTEKDKDSLLYFIKEIKENKLLSNKIKSNYSRKIIALADNKHDSLKFKANIEIALFYFRKRDLDSLKKYSLIAERCANRLNDLYKIQKSHFYLATYYKYKEIPDSAYYHYEQSKKILLSIGDTITAGRRLLNVVNIQFNEKDLLGSEITSITSLKYLEKSTLNRIKADLYNNLGRIAIERQEYTEALRYFDLSFQFLKKSDVNNKNVVKSILNYYINKAVVNESLKKHKEAISFAEKGLDFKNIEKDHSEKYALLLSVLAYNKYYSGDKKDVLSIYKKVLNIRKENNNLSRLSDTNNMIAFYYRSERDRNKAIFYAKEGLRYSKLSKKNDRTLEALNLLSKLTKGEKSKQYLEEYIQLNDSINTRERNMKNQFAKIRYETDKKEQENTVLKSENERKEAQLKSEKLQKTIGLISTGGTLALLGLSFLVFRNRRKRLLFQAQLEKAEAREKERQQIAKSLHDEVAGDLRILHQKLESNQQFEEAKKLYLVKENVRNLSHQLSSVSFDEVSFKDQIINLISDYFSPSFKIKVSGINDVNWKEIDNPIKRTLYLSIREAIQNTVKYAEASLITLSFEGLKKEVHLSIQDNGKGFNVDSKVEGIGLKNLKERVSELNGTIFINSNSEEGTNIKITLPLNV